MKSTFTLHTIAAILAVTFAGAAAAQNYSPRSNYGNPSPESTADAKRRGPCGDPWVTIALVNVYGRADADKCNVALYNGGHWSDFNQLVHAVAKQKNAGGGGASATKPTIDLTRIKYQCPSPDSCIIFSNGGDRVGLLSNGRFQAEMPAKLVAAGGGNLIGNDGSTLVGNDGASMVAAGSLNLISQKVNLNPPASPMSGYALQGINDFRALQAKTRK